MVIGCIDINVCRFIHAECKDFWPSDLGMCFCTVFIGYSSEKWLSVVVHHFGKCWACLCWQLSPLLSLTIMVRCRWIDFFFHVASLEYWLSAYVIIAGPNLVDVIWNRICYLVFYVRFTLIFGYLLLFCVFIEKTNCKNRSKTEEKNSNNEEKHLKSAKSVKQQNQTEHTLWALQTERRTREKKKICARKIATFTMTLTDAQKSLKRARK